MIRNCPNCASKIVFDASLGALSCDKCGGIFDVEAPIHVSNVKVVEATKASKKTTKS